MSQFYVVKGLGGGFDGLIVEGRKSDRNGLPIIDVARMTDRDSVVGDRNVSLPLPPNSLYIGLDYLEEIEDPGIREFAHDNPHGQFILEGRMELGNIQVVYAQYEKALQVSVSDVRLSNSGKSTSTVFAQYFSKNFDLVRQTIESTLKDPMNDGTDPQDLVFKLRELKETEANG